MDHTISCSSSISKFISLEGGVGTGLGVSGVNIVDVSCLSNGMLDSEYGHGVIAEQKWVCTTDVTHGLSCQ